MKLANAAQICRFHHSGGLFATFSGEYTDSQMFFVRRGQLERQIYPNVVLITVKPDEARTEPYFSSVGSVRRYGIVIRSPVRHGFRKSPYSLLVSLWKAWKYVS